jgi:uncharacterized protein YceH (UPF0502 family)
VTIAAAALARWRTNSNDHDAELERRVRAAEQEISAVKAVLNERKQK